MVGPGFHIPPKTGARFIAWRRHITYRASAGNVTSPVVKGEEHAYNPRGRAGASTLAEPGFYDVQLKAL